MGRDSQGRPLLVSVPGLPPDAFEGLEPEQAELLQADLEAAAVSAQEALAGNTTRTYRRLCEEFQTWSDRRGQCACPTTSTHVAAYLKSVGPTRGPKGPVPGRYVHGSLLVVVAALDKWHEAGGHPCPGDGLPVREQLAVAKVNSPPPGHRADPLLVEGLVLLLRAPDPRDAPLPAARDRLLTVLAADGRLGQGALAALDLADLVPTAAGLRVDGPGRGAVLPARGDAACPVRALTGLIAAAADAGRGAGGPALPGDDGGRYTWQGLVRRARALADGLALPVPPSGLPRCPPGRLAGALAEADVSRAEHPSVVRDRALVVSSFLRGLRSGSPGLITWDLAVPEPGHGPRGPVCLTVPRGKTDREGDGFPVVLEDTGNPDTSPAALFWDWVDVATLLLGGDPWKIMGDQPVFFPLRASGEPAFTGGELLPLSAQALTDVVVKRTAAVGLKGRMRGTSLRSGVVTSTGQAGGTAADQAAATGHKTLKSLKAYDLPEPGRVGQARRLGL